MGMDRINLYMHYQPGHSHRIRQLGWRNETTDLEPWVVGLYRGL